MKVFTKENAKKAISYRPFERVKDNYNTDEIFRDNEIGANAMISYVLIGTAVSLVLIWLAVRIRLFPVGIAMVQAAALQGIIEISVILLICSKFHNDVWWLKYLLLITMILIYSRLDAMLTHKVSILIILPVICSARYFSRKLTVQISVLTTLFFTLSTIIGSRNGWVDLNNVTLPPGTVLVAADGWIASGLEAIGFDQQLYTINCLLYTFLPRWIMFLLAAMISCMIAQRGREMVLTQKEMAESESRIRTELNLASAIQSHSLPRQFPPFPERKEFDIFASMVPAKEVGGDFYNFFFLDEDHLGLVIADVSGKGVPAALLMMTAMDLVTNCSQRGRSPADALSDVNEHLCNKDNEDMFITIWLGILDLRDGTVTACNAGHEYPILKCGSQFELMRDSHSFVVGAMKGAKFREYSFTMQPGSVLFLYTDGIPEATDDKNQMFGTRRTLEALNCLPDTPVDELVRRVTTDVHLFVENAPQFDDMTMLCIRYNGPGPNDDADAAV